MRTSLKLGAALLIFATTASPALGRARSTRAVEGTTLDQTIVAEGDRDLGYGDGEQRVTRTDLGWTNKKGKGRPLAGFKQLSDVHVVDEESPARVEYFDTCDETLSSAYRVQEAMSTQVGDSMLRALSAFDTGPGAGADLSFLVSTGDNIDNNQHNEQRWFIDLLDGNEVNPNSGAESYDGYTQEQFSEALGLDILDLANEPFDAVGAGVPWYAVLGNHDGLIQGNVQQNFQFNAIATSKSKAFAPVDDYGGCPEDPTDFGQLLDAQVATFGATAESVPADKDRSLMDHSKLVKEYFDTSTAPEGHGLAKAPFLGEGNEEGDHAGYYTFPMGNKVQGIVMDTINYNGGASGVLDGDQFEWLEKQMRKYSRKYYASDGKRATNKKGTNKLIVLFSHHSSLTLDNPGDDDSLTYHCFESSPGCDMGEGLHSLIDRYPNVIAWVNGHEHNNRVTPYPAPEGENANRGFWEINTAAHIDWPEQSRLVEIAFKPGKTRRKPDTVFIYGTIVDHGAAPDPDPDTQDTVEYLASLSRVEAYYDACVREHQASCDAGGDPQDRNVKLVAKAPFNLGN